MINRGIENQVLNSANFDGEISSDEEFEICEKVNDMLFTCQSHYEMRSTALNEYSIVNQEFQNEMRLINDSSALHWELYHRLSAVIKNERK